MWPKSQNRRPPYSRIPGPILDWILQKGAGLRSNSAGSGDGLNMSRGVSVSDDDWSVMPQPAKKINRKGGGECRSRSTPIHDPQTHHVLGVHCFYQKHTRSTA